MDAVARLNYADLVDLAKLQELLESFSKVAGMANAVFAPDGRILAQAGWIDACTQFHRANTAACERCIRSDTGHAALLVDGKPCALYTCENGLYDAVAPIVVDGQTVATVLTGQFFTNPPDLEYFREQGRRFGFDEQAYLDAIARVPVIARERVEEVSQLYGRLAAMLADNGLERLRHRQANRELQRLNKELEDRVVARTAQLAASEERLRLALNIASAGWFELNLRTGEVIVSPEYVRLLGHEPSSYQTSFEYWLSNVHPDDREHIQKVLRDGTRKTGVSEGTYRRRQSNGDWLWISTVGEVIEWSPQGEAVRLLGVHRDVTARKRDEAELERYRQELERLLLARTAVLDERTERLALTLFAMDRAGVAIAWCDPLTGRFLHVNTECGRQLGYSIDELLQMKVTDINPEFPREQYAAQVGIIRASESGLTFETIHQRKDGSRYPAEVTAYLTHSTTREWLISFFYDISDRKSGERELIDSKEAAESASRSKNAFLATVSHELRTPLNAIIGFSALIRDGVLGEVADKQRQPLDIIHRSGQQLLDLVKEILDLTSIEAGNLKVELNSQRLREVLLEQWESFQVQAAERGIELREVQCDETIEVHADRQRLSQVVRNLVANALKFTDEGCVAVSAARTGEMIRIVVEDSGIGIAADQVGLLFHPFVRAKSSGEVLRPGTGLGLAICKRLVAAMGGAIGVESEPGRGSRFWFTVPAVESPPAKPPA